MAPKKAKKSKAELEEERLAKEEEDRKIRVAEEKKAAEEAEKRRLEDLRIKAERKAFRIQELERLAEEHQNLVAVLTIKEKVRLEEEQIEKRKLEWAAHITPTEEPDSRNEKDMNTFFSLISEITTKDMSSTIDLIKRIEHSVASMEDVWSNSTADQNAVVQTRSFGYLKQFASTMLQKLDNATIQYLRFVDNYINDRFEINLEEVAVNVSMGLWASFNDIRPIRKSVQFEKIGIQIDIPKQILAQETRFVHRIIRMPVDTISSQYHNMSNVVASAACNQGMHYVVGDLIYFDILIGPPQAFSLRAKKWIIRDNSPSSTVIRRSAYPSSVACRCLLKVPDNVIMTDDIKAMVWNEETLVWSEEGISDFQYSEVNRVVQFYMTVVGVVALVKSRGADMPYKEWSLMPVRDKSTTRDFDYYEKHARLTVVTQKHEIVIDIVGTKCKLQAPAVKCLADLLDQSLTPGELIAKLQRRGINLLPRAEDAAALENITGKVAVLENTVIQQIAKSASALEFRSSTWNQNLTDSQIGILARESTAYVGGDTFDYECVLAELDSVSESFKNAPLEGLVDSPAVKFTNVMGNEYGDRRLFSHQARPNETTHVDIVAALSNRLTVEAKERIECGNERFHNTILTLLRLIKPYSFC